MELHQLRYFVSVARTGSFSRAAEQCHVAQPSLSQQIAKLEKDVHQPLFHRLGRRVVLTDAGRLLLEKATEILSAVEDTQRQLQDSEHQSGRRLSVGAIPTLAPYLLPPLLQKFAARHDGVELTVHEDVTKRLVASVAAGEIDFALLALPLDDERLQVETLFTEPLLLALPPAHRLAKRNRIRIDDLSDERFIVLNEMHCLGEQVLSFCRANACWPKIGCHSAQISTIESLILAGHGISLLPAMSRNPDSPALLYRALSGSQPARTIAVAWHKHRYFSQSEQDFLSDLRALSGGFSLS